MSNIHKIIEEISIVDVFKKLGFRLQKKGNNYICNCPFHEDNHPSLYIYEESNQFHCFACNKHGNIFTIIMDSENCNFISALKWLENNYPSIKNYIHHNENKIIQNFESIDYLLDNNPKLIKQTRKETEILKKFAEYRSFKYNFLRNIGFLYLDDINISNNETYHALKNRILIPLISYEGSIMGYVGRSLSNEKNKKYLFTSGLKKGELLYGIHKLISSKSKEQDNKDTEIVKLYVTEGIFDKLRIESLGIDSIAVLGSQITLKQCKVLKRYYNDKKNKVNINLFLDCDSAGLKGSMASIKNIWNTKDLFRIKINVVHYFNFLQEKTITYGKDPDEIFKNMNNEQQIDEFLDKNTFDVFTFIIIYYASVIYEEDDLRVIFSSCRTKTEDEVSIFIDRINKKLYDDNKRQDLFNMIDNYFSKSTLEKIITFYKDIEQTKSFEIIKNYYQPYENIIPIKNDNTDYTTKMYNAINIARNSYVKEDVCLDESTWNRICSCVELWYIYFKDKINTDTNINYPIDNINIPLQSIEIPKNIKDVRLKKLPLHENLIWEQYFLNELLGKKEKEYYENIPAVRYSRNVANLVTTGKDYYNFYKEDTENSVVSFAYQINMDAILGINTNGGMFRKFYDCWKDYVNYLADGIIKMKSDCVYILKLDISKFYDNISSSSIKNMLTKELSYVFELNNSYNTNKTDDNIQQDFIDKICNDVFGRDYYSSKDGSLVKSEKYYLGIPQGPNISAYLANILLFNMDKLVSSYIRSKNSKNENIVVARYARYVDDMVIITTSYNHMEHIKSIISNELYELGLKLSDKVDKPNTFNREEALNWVKNDNGGLKASLGDGDETVQEEVQANKDLLHIRRKKTLKLLNNICNGFNEISKENFNEIIKIFFKTKEVRYSELIRICKIYILVNLKDTSYSKNIYSDFTKDWTSYIKVSEKDSIFKIEGIDTVIFIRACLDILNIKYNRYTSKSNYDLYDKVKDRLKAYSKNYIKKINKDLNRLFNSDSLYVVNNQMTIEIKYLELLGKLNEVNDDFNLTNYDKKNEYSNRWYYHFKTGDKQKIYNHDNDNNLVTNKTLNVMHYMIWNLNNMGLINEKTVYDNLCVYFKENVKFKDFKNKKIYKVLQCMFNCDCDIDKDKYENEYVKNAIKLLLNSVTSSDFIYIVSKNTIVTKYILKDEEDIEVKWIPLLQGYEYDTIFAVRENNKANIKKVNIKKDDESNYENKAFIVEGKNNNVINWNPQNTLNENVLLFKCRDIANQGFNKLDDFVSNIFNLNGDNENKLFEKIIKYTYEWFGSLYFSIKSEEEKLKDNKKMLISSKSVFVNDDGNKFIILSNLINSDNLNEKGVVGVSQGNGIVSKEIDRVCNYYWIAGNILYDVFKIQDVYTFRISYRQRQFIDFIYSKLINKTYYGKKEEAYKKSIDRILECTQSVNSENVDIMYLNLCIENDFIEYVTKNECNSLNEEDRCYFLAVWAKNCFNNINGLLYEYICKINEEDTNRIFFSNNFDENNIRRINYAYNTIASAMYNIYTYYEQKKEVYSGLRILACGIYMYSILITLKANCLEILYNLASNEINKLKELEKEYVNKSELEAVNTNTSKNIYKKTLDLLNEIQSVDINELKFLEWIEIHKVLDEIITNNNNNEIFEKIINKLNFDDKDLKDRKLFNKYPFENIYYNNVFNSNEGIIELINQVNVIDNNLIKVSKIETDNFMRKKEGIFDIRVTIDSRTTIKSSNVCTYFASQNGNINYEYKINKITKKEELNVCGSVITILTKSEIGDKIVGVSLIDSDIASLVNKIIDNYKKNYSITTEEDTEKRLDDSLNTKDNNEILLKKESNLSDESELKNHISEKIEKDNCDLKNESKKDINKILNKILNIQKDKWPNRIIKLPNYDRIALFQFDIDNSYLHYKEEKCGILDEGVGYKNCCEYRRRKLLEKVFEACKSFNVEILLLPEYSVRTETVEWIKKTIDSQNYTFGVWAGTFKLTNGSIRKPELWQSCLFKESCENNKTLYDINPIYNNASFLPVVLSSITKAKYYNTPDKINDNRTDIIIMKRAKKYPAIPLKEDINPVCMYRNFEPVIKTNNVLYGSALDHVTELICAEMFAINTPTNAVGFAKSFMELFNNYNKSKITFKEAYDDILNDIKNFGETTLGINNLSDKRYYPYSYDKKTIILVPAVTTRTQDYYVIAESYFLGSGLVTVFCNGVNKIFKGGSCFIGQYSSSNPKDSKDLDKCPFKNVYHGVEPGIYVHQKEELRGPLGDKEQALLIYDVNPINTAKTSPNQQISEDKLKLVAHLPIIEISKHSKPIKYSRFNCRCAKSLYKSNSCIRECLFKICSEIDKNSYITTSDDTEPEKLAECLIKLGELTSSKFLKIRGKRYSYSNINDEMKYDIARKNYNLYNEWNEKPKSINYKLKQSYLCPVSWPPPTAIDWLYVEIDYSENNIEYIEYE